MKLLLVALFGVGILFTLMGTFTPAVDPAGVGPLAGACIVAAAIMDHTDRVLAKQRKDSSEDNSEKA